MYPPDGLLTLGSEHDVGLNPHIIAPDPYATDECLDVFPSPGPILLTATTMGDDDPPSGLNGRLRPRKSHAPNVQRQRLSKTEKRVSPDKQRRTSTPSKASPNKHDDLVNKSEFPPIPQFLCPYCDKKFVSKQTVSKHAQRMHVASAKQGSLIPCLFCNHAESNAIAIIRHMVDYHPNLYFACPECNTRFLSSSVLAEHKLNVCEKLKLSYRSKLRQKVTQRMKKKKKSLKVKDVNKSEDPPEEQSFNGVVISCELKPSQDHNPEDVEDNITTNLILPPSKSLGSNAALEKSAVIVLDDIQWNKRIPPNFTFHNTDADQILSRLGVVHKSPRTGEPSKKDWLKSIDETSLKFERCFDTTFYSKVSSNVQENLSKFLDGSFNFNPDPESVIKTRKSKKSVVINTAEGFPILLACEQYSRNIYDGYLPRSLAPRHKWIRDNLENEKTLINPDQIKRDSHVNNCIITLVSGLDIWTQLCMRRKFQDKNRSQMSEKKIEKRTNIRKELEDILESRELPSFTQVEKPKDKLTQTGQSLDFPALLGLVPSAPSYDVKPAVLSGEWVRPRCYVCCACGAQTRDPRTLTSHIATRHPNAQVQHYEIVGEVLLNADILKHLYVPPSQMCNRTRPLRGFRDCTKCMKSISLEDLHQHMLDCAGDTPAVRRRQCRQRPFGVRRRRPRLADNTVRKKIRKDMRTRQRRQKNIMRSRPKIRTEVGDAETIRKMLADLPAKRHRVLVNPLNHMTRPRIRTENKKKMIMMKKHSSEDNIKNASGSKDNIGTVKPEMYNPRNVASNSSSNDDNKSLRSKITRVAVKTQRQSQSLKRNANMNRIKRKSVRLKEQQIGNKVTDLSQDLRTQLSNEDSLKKVDIKGTGFKIREHANRSGSHNRGEQRQGRSRSNSNSNHSVAPAQSVPLKHSIARLTAKSEMHDKSVQFHHLFLVQQECNNANQQTPSGEHTLFENEAAIVRFDKPPLNFGQKASLDHQKIKNNKPRKGLNDCIAMLKHKLLDPVPSGVTEHVSVQCGGDDPLDFDESAVKQTTLNIDNYTENLLVNMMKTNENNAKLCRYSDQSATCETINEISEDTQSHNNLKGVTVEKIENEIESIKQNPKITSEKDSVKQSQKVISDKYFFTHEPNECSHKTVPGASSELNLVPKNSNSGNIISPLTSIEASVVNIVNQDIATLDESSQKSTAYLEFGTTCKNNPSDSDYLKKQASTHVDHEPIILLQKDAQIGSKADLAQKLPLEIFPQPKEFQDMPGAIPPAHASTNVTPMLTIPLDLSSKIIPRNNQITRSKNSNSVESYDETLDLSNKTLFDSKSMNNDDVVDLRVKPVHPDYPNTVDLCIKSCIDNTHHLRDFSDTKPTDLSVKGKVFDTGSNDCQYDRMHFIQDLSSNTIKNQESIYNPFVSSFTASQNCPTDLSGKPEHIKIHSKDGENSGLINKSASKKSAELDTININLSDPLLETRKQVSPQTNLLSSKSTVTQEDEHIIASGCTLKLNQKLESLHSQKSINDYAIPHYKTKATSTKQPKTPVKKFLTDSLDEYSCSSNNVPNIITSSSSLDSVTKTCVNISIKSCDSFEDTSSSTIISKSVTTPTGFLSSTQVTESINCFEKNYAPIYTSSRTSVPILTNEMASKTSCQSIIGTTVVSSTTIYTTSAELPSKHKASLEVPQIYSEEKEAEDTATKIETEIKINTQRDSCVAVPSDQDPETARKIALLPKELVEIIGNMPADHRNQLLNVLPQYVSTSSASCVPRSETEKVRSLELLGNSQAESLQSKELSFIKNTSGTTTQENEISKQPLPSPTFSDQISHFESSQPNKKIFISPTSDKDKKQLFKTVLNSEDDVKDDRDHHLADPFKALVSKKNSTVPEHNKSEEKVIDLTDEENAILSTDVVKVVRDLSNAVKSCSSDIPSLTSIEKPVRTKLNSEKTASLRAVRIKAPAERQKENQLLKRISVEQQRRPNASDSDDNEVNKSLEPNTSLAIQQAEISSTQSNKNVQLNINNEPEANVEESHLPLRSSRETIIENKDMNSHDPITKSAIVTSSVPVNDTSRDDVIEIIANKPSYPDHKPKESDVDKAKEQSNLSSREDNTTITDPGVMVAAIKLKKQLSNDLPKLIMETTKKSKIPPLKNKIKVTESFAAVNDDDSEDDVSLALIVKQKKNSMKMGDQKQDDILPDVTNAPLDQKEQRVFIDALNTDVHKVKPLERNKKVIKRNRRNPELQESGCNSRVLAETANVTNQRSKNKIKKRYNKKVPVAIEMSDSTNDGKIKNDHLFEKNLKNKMVAAINISEQETENVMLVDQNMYGKTKLDITKDETVATETESKTFNNDILSLAQKENINKSVSQKNKNISKILSEDKYEDPSKEQKISPKAELSSDLSTAELEKDVKRLFKPEEDTILEKQSHLENKKNKKVKLSNTIENTQEEVLNEHNNIEDSISTPLRRSRRGKSLYVENFNDSVRRNDTFMDHKTPITKKQLIFSKLLLDEETIAKKTENKQNKDFFHTNSENIKNYTVVNVEEQTASSSDFTNDISIDTIKGTKRRKTHQIKRKCKKKKTSDNSLGLKKNNDLSFKSMIDLAQQPNIKNQNSKPEKNNILENNEKKDVAAKKVDAKLEENNSKATLKTENVTKGKQLTYPIVKRKCDPSTSLDSCHVPKSKNAKVHTVPENTKSYKSIEIDTTIDSKISAAVSIPVAARRTRSKSVIVKSSTSDLYDPYDIDFDDLSEKAEPFRKTLKQIKAGNKLNKVYQLAKRDLNITEKDESEITDSAEGEKPKRNIVKLKDEPKLIETKYDGKVIHENICHCDAENSELKQKTSVAENRRMNEELSDSDDSSKSDVPLKKYFEEKEKRMAEKESNIVPKKRGNDLKTIADVKAVFENEEQLRSEQFMESFGFFSERKPRKSNLLAAKKISETFHTIANENDDVYYCSKQRITKKAPSNENKKNDVPSSIQQKSINKTRRVRKNRDHTESGPCYCYVCKKTFHRPDNYLRHQMTLLHISKLSEVEMKVQTNPIIEEPNYLVAFRDQINRLKEITLRLGTEKKKKNKIKMPGLDIILDKVNTIIEKQKLQQRGLSTDQALFLDCCELLKESHKPDVKKQESIIMVNEMHNSVSSLPPSLSEMDIIEKINTEGNTDSKSECDSVTAKSILESEEVRNLENDLISGLKEAAKRNRRNSNNIHCQNHDLPEISNERFSTPNTEEPLMQVDLFDFEEPELNESKKRVQTKTKMYPDVENIDIFEDKFDKIKRKCRSQAAAAKQTQFVIEASPGNKTRKKIEKKKGNKGLKKSYQSAVLTKGALKGFDGIKVSIPTSEINIPALNVSLPEISHKKKKRKFAKKKREKEDSDSITKYDSDSRMKEGSSLQKKHDVYEFMDNEDAELFEFRPSTLMERFKSMNSKEYHSKDAFMSNAPVECAENTSESGSDGDDFVYMSDDYVCSDDETQNSILSCEISNFKSESRKIFTPPKRKDVVEKNAVMGKIFKHNAVRTEKKEIKAKESGKPKTNLDQLFDSLLEDEPVSSTINNEDTSPCVNESEDLPSQKSGTRHSLDVPKDNIISSTSKMHDSSLLTEWNSPSTSKQGDYVFLSEPSTSKSLVMSPKKPAFTSTPRVSKNDIEINDIIIDDKSVNKDLQDDLCNESIDETGVARQRARRKCTVGKQNILAETWSSESEPDSVPIRSNSAESLVTTTVRKKRGKKREGNLSGGRRGNRPFSNKKEDPQSRVNSSQKTSTSSGAGTFSTENMFEGAAVAKEQEDNKGQDRVSPQSSDCAAPSAVQAPQGPLVAKGQLRSATSYWSPGGAAEQEHIQQHGWIVGDSHKKLVTMLAHAKGRKRHNDDERHLVE